MRPLNEIIVHCTATRPEWWAGKTVGQKVAEVRRWHTDPKPKGNGWRDIGYHYVIDRDGTVAVGRPLDQVGAHTMGRNVGTIGIALFGGHGSTTTDPFSKNFTPEQDKALRDLIARLRAQFPAIRVVSGHNQYAAKACPGFHAPSWYEAARTPSVTVAPPSMWTIFSGLLARLTGANK